MKRILTMGIVGLATVALAACGSSGSDSTSSEDATATATTMEMDSTMDPNMDMSTTADDTATTAAEPVATLTQPTGADAGTPIDVTASEFAFKLSTTTVPAGKVTFAVTNTGKAAHEMVVIETPTNAADMKPDSEGHAASEEGAVGEIGDDMMTAGAGPIYLTIDLKPGHYSLVCNVTGHYEGGMYADLTVT